MKITRLVLVVLSSISIAAYGGDSLSSEKSVNAAASDTGTAAATSKSARDTPPTTPPLKPYPRLLPLQLNAPPTARVDIPLDGISVNMLNPGESAPNARLRLIIHENDPGSVGEHPEVSPNTVRVEVMENGTWIPVMLGMVEGGVMGAIGPEGLTAHRERHQRDGFEIPAGFNKTWQLRVTFSLPGTYSLVVAVSPDNGSRHLAQPAHSIIVVQ